jgi:hypothetical protein
MPKLFLYKRKVAITPLDPKNSLAAIIYSNSEFTVHALPYMGDIQWNLFPAESQIFGEGVYGRRRGIYHGFLLNRVFIDLLR